MSDKFVVLHRGKPAHPPVVNGITFFEHPTEPGVWVGETADAAAVRALCHDGSPFWTTEASLPSAPAPVVPPPAAPAALQVAEPQPPVVAPAPAPVAAGDAPDAAIPADVVVPGVNAPAVPDNVIAARPAVAPIDGLAMSPEVILALRQEQQDLQAKEAKTAEEADRLAEITDQLAFVGFQQ